MKLAVLMLGSLLGGAFSLLADPAKTPLPSGPILKKMEDSSSWRVVYSYPDEKTPNPAGGAVAPTPAPAPPSGTGEISLARLRMLTVTRTRPIWHAVGMDINGKAVEQWSMGKGQILLLPGLSSPLIGTGNLVPGADAFTSLQNYDQNDFPELQWIAAKNYTGSEVVNGVTYFVFQEGDNKAWIDSTSRFPLRLLQKNAYLDYQVLPAPAGPLAFPPAVAELIKQMEKTIKAGGQQAPKKG